MRIAAFADASKPVPILPSRITAAGGVPAKMFTREAVILIHEYSRGIPRTINVIADNALLGGFAKGQRLVTRDLVREVCRDFDIAHRRRRRARTVDTKAGDARDVAARAEPAEARPNSAPSIRRSGSGAVGRLRRASPGARFSVSWV